MRTSEQISADAAAERPFSNHTEWEIWADAGRGCYDCANDDPDRNKYCPILTAALPKGWPAEWTRRTHTWQAGDASGTYDVVDECTEFEERTHWPGDGDDPDNGPPPPPAPPAVIDGQVDMFEVFTDQIVEQVAQVQREQVSA